MSEPNHSMPPLKHFTVVYTVRDEAAFVASDEWQRIHASMAADSAVPFSITAMSRDHEMRRVTLMEEATERYRHYELADAIEAISQCPDLSQWSWDKFENDDEISAFSARSAAESPVG
jgi:hypothetical protein